MADNLQVKILVDGSQLSSGMRQATDEVEQATARLNTSFSRVGPAWEEATHEIAFSTREAKHAIGGLGEEIGVHVPRFVQTLLADLGGVGPALAAAFTPVAIVGLIDVFIKAGEKAFDLYENIVNLKKEFEALDSIEKKLADDMIQMSNALAKGSVHLTELTSGKIAAAKQDIIALGQEITDLGKMVDVSGKQFKDLGVAARSSLREFLIPTQAKDFADVLGRVGLEIKRVQSLMLNTEQGTTEYKALSESVQALSTFYDTLALKVQTFNQDVQIATAEQVKAEQEAADKALKERDRLAKEAARLSHDRAIAELNDLERVQKEEARILGERAKENAEFSKKVEEEIKKKDEVIAQLQNRALGEIIQRQHKALAEQERLLKESQKPYVELGHAITRGFDTMIQGVLMGTQTIGTAFARLGADMLIVMAEALAKIYLKHLAHWIAVNVLEKVQITQSIGTLIAGATAKKAVQTTANTESVIGDAGVAGAAAFASVMEALPFPANVATAPGVMAAAVGTALSNLALTSAAGGLWQVPSDQLALVHKNESILPSGIAGSMRDFFGSGSGGGGRGGDVHIHVSAVDTQTGADFLSKNMDHIANEFRRRAREFR